MAHRRRTTRKQWLALLGIAAFAALIALILAQWGNPENGFETLHETPRREPLTANSPQRHGARAERRESTAPFSPAPPPLPTREDLLVTVANQDGAPLGAVPVTLVHEDLHTEIRSTDAEGQAHFRHPGAGWIMAKTPASFAVTVVVKQNQASYFLTVQDSPFSLDGRLYIDGYPAGSGKKLLVRMPLSRWSAIPWPMSTRLAKGESPDSFFAVTDADGRFSVRGLELGDGFYVTLPAGLIIAEGFPYAGNETAHISDICQARTSIEIHAVQAPTLSGRCLDASGTPLTNVEINVLGIVSGRRRRIAPALASNTEGEFRLAMDFASWLPVTLEARWAGAVRQSDPIETPWTGEQDLTPFVFPVSAPLKVQVRDAAGQPISSAKVGIGGQHELVMDVDAEGEAILQLPPRHSVHLQVAAWGYQFVDQEVETTENGGVRDITMSPANVLQLRLRDARSEAVAKRPLELLGPVNMLRNGNAWDSAVYRSTIPNILWRKRDSSARLIAFTNSRGEARFYDLAENAPLRAMARAHDNIILAEAGPIRLRLGEHKRIDINLGERRTSALAGVVVDETGKPIAQAHVRISQSIRGYGGTGATSDLNGRFTINQVALDAAYFNASKPGYIPERVFLEGLRERKEPLRFALRRALECEIEVRNADGSLAPEATIEFPYRRDGGQAIVNRRGDGTFHVMNLMDEPVTFRVEHGHTPAFKVRLRPASEPIKVVPLPPKGRLRVHWKREPSSQQVILYRSKEIPRGYLSPVSSRSSIEAILPAGHYRIGRAHRVGDHFEFTEDPQKVKLRVGDELDLTID